jgi:hypothetical protein
MAAAAAAMQAQIAGVQAAAAQQQLMTQHRQRSQIPLEELSRLIQQQYTLMAIRTIQKQQQRAWVRPLHPSSSRSFLAVHCTRSF